MTIDIRFFREMMEYKLDPNGPISAADSEQLLMLAQAMMEDTEYLADNSSLRYGGHFGPQIFDQFIEEWTEKFLTTLVNIKGYAGVKDLLEQHNPANNDIFNTSDDLGDLDAHPF